MVGVFNKTLKEHAPVFVKNMTEDFISRKMEEFNIKIGITLTNNEIRDIIKVIIIITRKIKF